MDLPSISFNLLLVLFFIFLNGFFVAAEFAMVKIRPSRLQQLVQEGHSQAKIAQHITDHLDAYLSACQLGITLASLALGALGEPVIGDMIEPGLQALRVPDAAIHTIAFTISFIIITMLHIVLGELAPKSLAIRNAEGTTLFVALPLKIFHDVFLPAIWALNGMANRILHLIGIPPVSEHEAAHTEEEIRILMHESAKSGLIDQSEMAMFNKMFRFSDRSAHEIMVPRVDMICIDRNAPFAEIRALSIDEGRTRYPVCDGGKDNVVGFVHIRDLFTAKREDIDSITREVLAVPGNHELSAVLRKMQKAKAQLAIVMDEYGGTAGMLTIEDILEEIVGEIQDEFDDERPLIEQQGDAFSIDGNMLIEDLNKAFCLSIETEAESLGGWMYSLLGRAPLYGDTIEEGGVRFFVAELDHLRIVRVRIENAQLVLEGETP
ncbi:MAG TPA: hypothetical protein DD435_12785 [Cyanobacteria bacterium UBA8530]|nr:hypothetical protein [Cyanobacteria bacterium UBA8530]